MLTIIQIEPGTDNLHDIQSQSLRTACWLPGYIEVPSSLQSIAEDSGGYCDLTIEGGVLVGITPTERPPKPDPAPTEMELAQQDITDLQLNDIEQGQQITDLELTILGGGTGV